MKKRTEQESLEIQTEKMSRKYLPLAAAILLLLSLLARGMGYIYSIVATDVMYTELTATVVGILTDVLAVARTAAGYGIILYISYRWGSQSGYGVGTVLLMDAADGLSRFGVDMITSSITDREVLALQWLFLQFCGSSVLVLLCWWIGQTVCQKKGKSVETAMTWSVLGLLAGHLLLNVYYLVNFLTTYTNVNMAEWMSVIGEFLYTVVFYGGIAWGMGILFLALLGQWFGKKSAFSEYGE